MNDLQPGDPCLIKHSIVNLLVTFCGVDADGKARCLMVTDKGVEPVLVEVAILQKAVIVPFYVNGKLVSQSAIVYAADGSVAECHRLFYDPPPLPDKPVVWDMTQPTLDEVLTARWAPAWTAPFPDPLETGFHP